ncbi:nitric oxide synthase oxygenase [Sphingobium sufflavum]|uniref:nitric oxide synthase oxygenase n=1 Tax=Sphingobium sufflavum TaxID=1129547 RepID=UPI001F27EFE6|nr:nitric oxide synthase oxygenase [Sphingobium sufflavum]MCE7798308.1 nitric oxide synthase oxygenase [Sphingobium sufflavum]
MPSDRYISSDPVRRRLRRLSQGERREEAVAFIRQYAREVGMADEPLRLRIAEICDALRRTNHYVHTPEELSFGARIAWRNHARCVGRLTWKSLRVHDHRHIAAPAAVLEQTMADLKAAFNGGQIRSSISIFAPATDKSLPSTFESSQIFRYAGYATADEGVMGDRANIELTHTARQLGWQPPETPGPFDLLPVILRDQNGGRHAFAIPPSTAREVLIEHPTRPDLAALGLRWYAVPIVSNMALTIGGIDYPCAPFNGYYLATEIASRNLVDAKRYDLLEPIAHALGLVTDAHGPAFWKDEALTELNRAVLHSFEKAGVRIMDHHEVSAQYMNFMQLEQRAGRTASGEWSWIVPPQASAGCPTFHLPMTNLHAVPNFYHSRYIDGGTLRLDRTHMRDGKWRSRYERLKRRWRDWRRRRDRIWQRS